MWRSLLPESSGSEQVPQVPMASYVVLHKDQSIKLLVADCTPHSTFCIWSDISTTLWIFRGPEACVFFVHEPVQVQMGSVTKTQAVQCGCSTLYTILHSASAYLVTHPHVSASRSTTFYFSDYYMFF